MSTKNIEGIHVIPFKTEISRIYLYLFLLFHKIFFYRTHKKSIIDWMKYATHSSPEKIYWRKNKKRFCMEWNWETMENNQLLGNSYSIPSFLQ